VSDIGEFLELMPDTVGVEAFVSRNPWGIASYGARRDYRARVTYKTSYVRAMSGEQIVARGYAILATTDPIGDKDRITLPDGEHPSVLSADRESDENGPLYSKLYFG
jgi:hypothetical protein